MNMGATLDAYIDVDQHAMDEIIAEHRFNTTGDEDEIAKAYTDKYMPGWSLKPLYFYNEDLHMHEMLVFYGIKFLMREERFLNRRYHHMYEQQHGKPYPLEDIRFIHSKATAIRIAAALEEVFPDDSEGYRAFAKWLRETAKYCSVYDESY